MISEHALKRYEEGRRKGSAQQIASLGLVKFPIEDHRWVNTQAGTLVKLVIAPPENNEWRRIFSNAYVQDILSGRLMGDSRREPPMMSSEVYDCMYAEYRHFSLNAYTRYGRFWHDLRSWREFHYPHANARNMAMEGLPGEVRTPTELESRLSIPYLGVVVMGVTRWSGFSKVAPRHYWYCTLGDLTVDGQRLFTILERVYEGAKLHLLTFVGGRLVDEEK